VWGVFIGANGKPLFVETRKKVPSAADLFGRETVGDPEEKPVNAPLAARMRPQTLEEVLGQDHLLGEGKLLRRAILADRLSSLIFYGPPGCGKTTLACIISKVTQSHFGPINAVTSNVKELRQVIEDAALVRSNQKIRTILFIDEIHRFNKAQQDVLMPDVEDGNLILIGATIHNPSFSLTGPLLSRSLVFELRSLEEADLIRLLKRALQERERGLGGLPTEVTEGAIEFLARSASGDARRALNTLEVAVLTT
jgi:putative ATPase